ncbi:hypothetical protein K439DRAFT_1613114 [Ramaria rubella]|nr:hypothetical protein K439DRAFT_1613114 [Ramaria rubella]
MRFLAIISILFAVTQVAFSAPVFLVIDSDVVTRTLQPAQLQGRGVGNLGVMVRSHPTKLQGTLQKRSSQPHKDQQYPISIHPETPSRTSKKIKGSSATEGMKTQTNEQQLPSVFEPWEDDWDKKYDHTHVGCMEMWCKIQ